MFGFKCFLIDSGVAEFPPLDADGFAAAMSRDRPARRAADRPRRGRRRHRRTHRPRAGAAYSTFLRSRPPAAEDRAIDDVLAAAAATGGRAHILHLSSADALPELHAARAAGVDVSVETCPHYLALRRGADPGRRDAVQVLPADPRRREPGPAVGRAGATATSTWSSPTTRRARSSSSGSTPATSARPGAASRRCSSACRSSGPPRGRAGIRFADVVRWMATAPADRVGLGAQGTHRGRRRRRPVRARPGRRVRRRPGAAAAQEPDLARTPGSG